MSANDKSISTGELAKLTGPSSDTIRHYERMGILTKAPRTASGYRIYAPEAIERVQLAQRALQLGFTLTELSEILRVRDRGGVPCNRVLAMTEEKLDSLEQKIQDLRRTQRYMRRALCAWRKKLIDAPPGSKAMLLNSLSDGTGPRVNTGANNLKRK
jgi:MerR family mercuric resistance operon transcriptional regulator